MPEPTHQTITMSNEPPKWSTSDAKQKLTAIIKDETSKIHTTMTFDELYKMEAFRIYKRDNFRKNSNRLYEHLTGKKKVWPSAKSSSSKTSEAKAQKLKAPEKKTGKKKKVEPWKTSLAKAFLIKLLTDPSQPLKSMSPKQVYESHTVFQDYPFKRFKENMKSLADCVEKDNELAKNETKEIRADMKRVKRNELTIRGYPFWHTHKAKSLLSDDVKSGEL